MTAFVVIKAVGIVSGVVLLGYGFWFILSPAAAMHGTYHLSERLPFVMGGRYFFFGALLIAGLLYNDSAVTSFLLAGFAGLGFFDAILYADSAPLPHIAVGVLALAASLYFFRHRKVFS